MDKHDEATEHIDMITKLDERYEPKHKIETIASQPQRTQGKKIGIIDIAFILFVIIVASYFLLYSDIDEFHGLQRWVGTRATIGAPAEPDVALVELYKFNDLSSNVSVNVELWLKNIGDETATDIEIFVRARNQNGTVLFSELVPTSVLLLEEDETCSAIYSVPISEDDTNIYHTVEISWEDGRIMHSKTTNL